MAQGGSTAAIKAIVRAIVLCAAIAAAALSGATSGPAQAAQAPEIAKSDYAEVSLIADRNAVAPGDRFTVALHQKMAPHWHTYWANPGAVGLPTTIAWTAPEGLEIGEIQWPTPNRVPTGDFVNFGYEDEAILLVDMTVPADWPVGRPIDLVADADWLVCRDSCFPERGRFTLSLPVAEKAQPDFMASLLVARGRSALPPRTGAQALYRMVDDQLVLSVDAPAFAKSDVEDHFFFPVDDRVAAPSAPQATARTENGPVLTIQVNKSGFSGPLEGVLTATHRNGGDAGGLAIAVTALPEAESAAAPIAASSEVGGGEGRGGSAVSGSTVSGSAAGTDAAGGQARAATPDLGLGLGASLGAAALLAFLGGAILNVFPCVFPVLALKAVSIAKSAQTARDEDGASGLLPGPSQGLSPGLSPGLSHGLAYTAGVLVSFLAIAAALVSFKAAGAAVGWGFQLQSPLVVAVLAYVLVLVGLNLSGVYEIRSVGGNVGQSLAAKDGRVGDFFTGVLAAVVAAPCTAPFMGAALGYALTQDAATAFVVFIALGLGFAAPILLLSASPQVAAYVPKPGPWMERFRQALAFPMYLAAAWLFWVLGGQAGVDALFAALAGAVLLGFAAWTLGVGRPESANGRTISLAAAALALIGAVWALSPSLGTPDGVARAAEAGAVLYDAAALDDLRSEGRTVFLNVTADWCISCKVNEISVLSGERFAQTLAAADAVYMKGDWTVRDARITELLSGFGRIGVPLYVVYPGEADPIVLPQILTQAMVAEALAVK